MAQSEADFFALKKKSELDQEGYDSDPLESDDYVVRVQKIVLQKEPTWNNDIKRFDYDKQELQYTLVCIPYKPKSEDKLRNTKGEDVKTLSQWIFRRVNPGSTGFTLQGEPSFMRSLLAYFQGINPDPEVEVTPPGVVIVTKNGDVASEADTEEYKKQFIAVQKGELDPKDFTMRDKGFTFVPDLREFEGKYIGARIIADEKGRNKITAFSRLPSSFTPDAAVEEEALKDFDERWQKYLDNRKNKTAPDRKAAASSEEVVDDKSVEF